MGAGHYHPAAGGSHATPRAMGGHQSGSTATSRRPPPAGVGRSAGGVIGGSHSQSSRGEDLVAVEGVVTAPAMNGGEALAMAMNASLSRDSAKEGSNDNSPERAVGGRAAFVVRRCLKMNDVIVREEETMKR